MNGKTVTLYLFVYHTTSNANIDKNPRDGEFLVEQKIQPTHHWHINNM